MRDNVKHRIAFATCRNLGGLTPDDQLAADLLGQQNIVVNAVPWDDESINLQIYDAVILRSTWDYHQRLPEFLRWISQLEEMRVPLWNPPNVVRANVSKSYLVDLQNEGVPIVPTVLIRKGVRTQLKDVLNNQGWNRAIIKPDVSASAYRTITTDLLTASDFQEQLDMILKDSGALIQEFRNEIIDRGEWSLMFFQRRFSHAVLKRPAPGDFRVQEELGGIVQPASAPDSLIAQALNILHSVDSPLLYARIDGILTENQFLLMELELIEPSLFLGSSNVAAERFATAIVNIL